MANLLDEGVADTLVSAVSAALFQRRQLPVQRPNLLESRGGIAQECGNTEKGPGITAKRKDRKFDRDLSAVLVEARHRQALFWKHLTRNAKSPRMRRARCRRWPRRVDRRRATRADGQARRRT
jgi:hypothetical protein